MHRRPGRLVPPGERPAARAHCRCAASARVVRCTLQRQRHAVRYTAPVAVAAIGNARAGGHEVIAERLHQGIDRFCRAHDRERPLQRLPRLGRCVKRLTIIYCSCDIEVNVLLGSRGGAHKIGSCAMNAGGLTKASLSLGSEPYTENDAMSSKTSQLKDVSVPDAPGRLSLSAIAYDALRARLRTGLATPEDRLVDMEIAAQLGMS